MDPPPSLNTVTVCNQTILLILYYISSRPITLLKVTDAPVQVYDIFVLLLVSSSFTLALEYSFFCPWYVY